MLLKNFYHVVFFKAKGQSVKFARERAILFLNQFHQKTIFFRLNFLLNLSYVRLYSKNRALIRI